MTAHKHLLEDRRLAALTDYAILDSDREESFDDIVALAAMICDAPVAVVNFIDRDRQWFKAELGLGVQGTPLDISICAHAILEQDFLVIPDTHDDDRTSANPLCMGQGFRAYAGALLNTSDGLPIGTLCVLDRVPRTFDAEQIDALSRLARQVMRLVELRAAGDQQMLLRREVDHRVKNSFQSVSALVSLQARGAESALVKDALADVAQRIAGIAVLHDEMNLSTDGLEIELAQFMTRLARLFETSVMNGVSIDVDVTPMALPVDQASALGIIANEFVANACKHAFYPNEPGRIGMRGVASEARYDLSFSHGGRIDDQTLERIRSGTGLGIRLINMTARSLGWTANWSVADGRLTLSIIMAT